MFSYNRIKTGKDYTMDYKDITEIKIKKDLPPEQRLNDFIQQIKNPYNVLYQDFNIKIQFSETDKTIKDVLNDYEKALKNQF